MSFSLYDEGDDWKFGCCSVCNYRGAVDCDRCEDADCFELDPEVLENMDPDQQRQIKRHIPIRALEPA